MASYGHFQHVSYTKNSRPIHIYVHTWHWLLLATVGSFVPKKAEPQPGEPPTPIHTNAEKYYKIMVDSTSIIFALYMYWNRQTLCDQSRRRRVNNFKLKALNFLRIDAYLVFHTLQNEGVSQKQQPTGSKIILLSFSSKVDTLRQTRHFKFSVQSVWFWTCSYFIWSQSSKILFGLSLYPTIILWR